MTALIKRRRLGRDPGGWIVIGGVTALNLLLAAVSFFKDLAFAGYFGTSDMADALNTAFLLPDTLGANLYAYVLGVTAVPHLSLLWASSRQEEFVRSVKAMAVHSVSVTVILGFALAGFNRAVLSAFGAPGIAGATLSHLFILLLPCLIIFPLSAIGGAALQAAGSFYMPSLGPVIYNLFLLSALVTAWSATLDPVSGGWLYAVSILAGTGLAAITVWLYLAAKVPVLAKRPPREPGMDGGSSKAPVLPKGFYLNMLPFFLVILFTQGLYAMERLIASHGPVGTLAGLGYAFRIAQFPNWVFVSALTAVILPSLSRGAGPESHSDSVGFFRALKATLLVMVPAALILCLGREPLITLLFSRGAFGADSVAMTADLLAGYSLSVVGQAVSAVCLRYCLAGGLMKASAWIYGGTLAAGLLFDLLAFGSWGPRSLGYGALIAWTLNAAFMTAVVLRDSKNRRGYPWTKETRF